MCQVCTRHVFSSISFIYFLLFIFHQLFSVIKHVHRNSSCISLWAQTVSRTDNENTGDSKDQFFLHNDFFSVVNRKKLDRIILWVDVNQTDRWYSMYVSLPAPHTWNSQFHFWLTLLPTFLCTISNLALTCATKVGSYSKFTKFSFTAKTWTVHTCKLLMQKKGNSICHQKVIPKVLVTANSI